MSGLRVGYVRYMDDWVVLAPTGGFEFLGYRFDGQAATHGLGVAQRTVAGCQVRMTRLYERGASARRIGLYVLRWLRWLEAGGVGGDGMLWDGWGITERLSRSRSTSTSGG